MKLTFQTLNEMIANVIEEDELVESRNTLGADVNEIMLGFYLLGGAWDNFQNSQVARETIKKRKTQIDTAEFEDQIGRAKEMAKTTMEWARANGFDGQVIKAWWTARPGELTQATGVEVDSRKNPTDTLIQFADGSFLGISAKSTKGKGDIGAKNPGLGSLGRSIGTDFGTHIFHMEEEAVEAFDLPTNKKQRKGFIRDNPDIQQQTIQVGIKILNTLRERLFDYYKEKFTNEEMKNHILNVWLDADEVYPAYIKVTGHGKNGNYTASLFDPISNPKVEALATERVSITKIGNESIGFSAGDVRLFKARFKYESEKLASAIKLSADPW